MHLHMHDERELTLSYSTIIFHSFLFYLAILHLHTDGRWIDPIGRSEKLAGWLSSFASEYKIQQFNFRDCLSIACIRRFAFIPFNAWTVAFLVAHALWNYRGLEQDWS